ncbi:hypothetical protein [Ottowia sp.]|jgi:hypothetical protein|uniref:hypothetical protein n=1 Tax=Ottowia sp. TaxID=1898956 RepID=UPI0025D4DF6A|nr:hypothetical protein [Ottowia sp.]MBK6614267.1 hypothetical protein [Ottowia sp.]MBK6745174.1 hypothetical protein [Ottowia sp.]
MQPPADSPTPAALLRPEHAAWIARGVSTIVASRDALHHPSLMRAVGADIAGDGGRITVYLNQLTARQVLADLEATGQIAVVFSEPSTNRSLQVKARRVELRPAEARDAAVLQRYLRGMEWQLGQIGFSPVHTRAMLAHRLDDVVAVGFTPEQAFDQTPGRQAGAPLAGGTRP